MMGGEAVRQSISRTSGFFIFFNSLLVLYFKRIITALRMLFASLLINAESLVAIYESKIEHLDKKWSVSIKWKFMQSSIMLF